MLFLDAPPRYLFFTGKGGVGKTRIACATAVHLADRGGGCCWSAPIRRPTSGRSSGCPSAMPITAIRCPV